MGVSVCESIDKSKSKLVFQRSALGFKVLLQRMTFVVPNVGPNKQQGEKFRRCNECSFCLGANNNRQPKNEQLRQQQQQQQPESYRYQIMGEKKAKSNTNKDSE